VKRSLKFQFDNDIEDQTSFIKLLPQDLKHYVSLFIFEHIYKKIDYLDDKPMTFITWICPQMTPMVKSKDQFVFRDGDDVSCIYFLVGGKAGIVLPYY